MCYMCRRIGNIATLYSSLVEAVREQVPNTYGHHLYADSKPSKLLAEYIKDDILGFGYR